MENGLTHFDQQGNAVMVDVSEKAVTHRIAVASGKIFVNQAVYDAIVQGTVKKGDVLGVARVAGIMAAKKTSDLIPLCHPLMLTKVEVTCAPFKDNQAPEPFDGHCGIRVETTCSLVGKTGVEMEALTAASVACLTIYDMCKAVDRGMEIGPIRLLHKEGGKSGTWDRQ